MTLKIVVSTAFVCVFTVYHAVYSQTVNGRIIDKETQEALPLATIQLNDSTFIYTDQNGKFELADRVSDRLIISYMGYDTLTLARESYSDKMLIKLNPAILSLNEVVTTAYDSDKRLLEVPGSVGLVTQKDIQRSGGVSLQSSLNLIPGVMVDQSHLGDSRISIRGVGVRSSYGIRNLKIYLNEIPLTEANGFTRLEGLDIGTLGSVEVIKGPASSIYGSGLGGVLTIRSEKAPSNAKSFETSAMAGSYGLFKWNASLKLGGARSNVIATFGTQQYSGYRNHSADERKFVSVFARFYPSEKTIFSVFVNHSQQNTQLPGALDSIQFAENPTMASAPELEKDAGRNQSWTRVGVSADHSFSQSLSLITTIYTSMYDLDHPIVFAYIKGQYLSLGGRSRIIYEKQISSVKARFTLGGEYLQGNNKSRYYINNRGAEGDMTQDKIVNAYQYSIFGQADFEFKKSIILTTGVSTNSIQYRIEDLLKSNGVDFTGKKVFRPVVTPRVGLSKIFRDQYAVYSSISYGFSPPTDGEISNPDGSINYSVEAEKGINYELGTRGDFLKKRLSYDVSFFSLQLSNELIPQTVAPYQTVYVNAGKTAHNGIESTVSYKLTRTNKSVSLIRPFISYTLNNFYFKEYRIDNKDYSGKKLTGVPSNIFNAGLDIETKFGLYVYTTFQYIDRFPILDDNSIYTEGYSLLNCKAGYRKYVLKNIPVEIFAGVNNMLDSKYSSFVSLNAKGFGPGSLPRFYNPSPRRNYYTGLSIKYIF